MLIQGSPSAGLVLQFLQKTITGIEVRILNTGSKPFTGKVQIEILSNGDLYMSHIHFHSQRGPFKPILVGGHIGFSLGVDSLHGNELHFDAKYQVI